MCTDELIVSCVEVLQGGCDMECPSSSECVTPVGRDNDRESVRYGIRVDGEWSYQAVRGGESQRGSVGTCTFFVQGPHLHISLMMTRFLQLRDATKGLNYIHDEGVVHGDLKGVRF